MQKRLPAQIIIQANSLVDKTTIDNLYKASNAGVNVHLIIRGICNLVPNIKGQSENIRVRSILGRFEHSRIYYFQKQPKQRDPLLYAGSADAMPRNFFKRIECVFPIEDADNRQRILDILDLYLKDNANVSTLRSNGLYYKNKLFKTKKQIRFSAQEHFIERSKYDSQFKLKISPIALFVDCLLNEN